MADIVPSFILKADRAEKHLGHLKVKIDEWASTHPYEVRTTLYRKRKAYHLRFTSNPPPEVSLIAADFVYNLRSGLDHLMSALVPSSRRDSVYFPIYFEGVWEDPVPGEDEEVTKARGRWKSDTTKVRPEAVTILKALQPKAAGEGVVNTFRVLNVLSNTDRHQKLPVVFSALKGIRLIYTDAQGRRHIGPVDTGEPFIDERIAKDGAELVYPKDAVNVYIAGTPLVAIEISEQGNIEIPETFDRALDAYRSRTVAPLAPYVHPGPHGRP